MLAKDPRLSPRMIQFHLIVSKVNQEAVRKTLLHIACLFVLLSLRHFRVRLGVLANPPSPLPLSPFSSELGYEVREQRTFTTFDYSQILLHVAAVFTLVVFASSSKLSILKSYDYPTTEPEPSPHLLVFQRSVAHCSNASRFLER